MNIRKTFTSFNEYLEDCHSLKDATTILEHFAKIVTSRTHNEGVENSLNYLERSVNQFKEVEELLERLEDITLNESNLTGLPSRKGWDVLVRKAKEIHYKQCQCIER